MKPKVTIYVETSPLNFEKSVIFTSDVDIDNDGTNVYLKPDKVQQAIALLASSIGAVVTIDGEGVELQL